MNELTKYCTKISLSIADRANSPGAFSGEVTNEPSLGADLDALPVAPAATAAAGGSLQTLDTHEIAKNVRELLQTNNIGQRVFAKHVLGLSQGTVSELLSKPKRWERLTEKGRESYRKMHFWAQDAGNVQRLKAVSPRKGGHIGANVAAAAAVAASTCSMVVPPVSPQFLKSDAVLPPLPSSPAAVSTVEQPPATESLDSKQTDALVAQILADIKRKVQREQTSGCDEVPRTGSPLFCTNLSPVSRHSTLASVLESTRVTTSAGAQSSVALVRKVFLQELKKLMEKAQTEGNNTDYMYYKREYERALATDGIQDATATASSSIDGAQSLLAPIAMDHKTRLVSSTPTPTLMSNVGSAALRPASHKRLFSNADSEDSPKRPKLELFNAVIPSSRPPLETSTNPLFTTIAGSAPLSTAPTSLAPVLPLLSAAALGSSVSPFNLLNQMLLPVLLPSLSASLPKVSPELLPSLALQNLNLLVANQLNGANSNALNQLSAFRCLAETAAASAALAPASPDDESKRSAEMDDERSQASSVDVDSCSGAVGVRLADEPLNLSSFKPAGGSASGGRTQAPGRQTLATALHFTSPSKANLPAITEEVLGRYSELNTELVVSRVKQLLSAHSISQRLFGEAVLGLSQGSVSDILSRPKPWSVLSAKGREPYIRMALLLDSPEHIEYLIQRQLRVNSRLPNTSSPVAGNGDQKASPILFGAAVKHDVDAAPAVRGAADALTASFTMSPQEDLKFASHGSSQSSGSEQQTLGFGDDSGSPLSPSSCAPSSRGALESVGGGTGAGAGQRANVKGSVLAMLDSLQVQEVDTMAVTNRVRELLSAHNIGQKLFGELVLGLSQGSVSEILSKPKLWSSLSVKGRYARTQFKSLT